MTFTSFAYSMLCSFLLSRSSFLKDSVPLSSYRVEQTCSPFLCQGLHHPILCIFFETNSPSIELASKFAGVSYIHLSFMMIYFSKFCRPEILGMSTSAVFLALWPHLLFASFAVPPCRLHSAQDSAARRGCTWHMLQFQCRH